MSGIAGIVSTDGKPVDCLSLQRMLQAISHRGPDGSGVWHRDGAGLGHATFRTLAKGAGESLPPVDGELVLTADLRLDNRDELIATLGLSDQSLSDDTLIIAAYRKWGDDCPGHLLGDFAFALWDGRRKLLFCARDHFGVRPFYYHAGDTRFAFGSEIKALLALHDVPRRIDEARIADYLVALVPDNEATLYADIRRLPPGHALTVSASGRRLRSYWRLEPRAVVGTDDFAEAFLDLFATSVRCRLRGRSTPGAMLSGGLDSSSIACLAAPIVNRERGVPLPTLSLVFDKTPAWSERRFIEAVLEKGGFDPGFVAADGYAPFADFGQILVEQDGAYLAPGLAVTRQLYRAAHDRGIRVLLDGHGGDEVVSHGYGRLHELARANRWLKLWSEARGLSDLFGDSAWRIFGKHFRLHAPGRRLRSLPSAVGRRLRGPGNGRPMWASHVDRDLLGRSDLASRYRSHRRAEMQSSTSESTQHQWALSSGLVAHAFEVLDHTAAAAGVEPRYPFYDKRLVEFCLALPSEEKLNGGWSRLILRRAMEGILPAAVQWRHDKLDFSPHIIRGVLRHHRDLLDDLLAKDPEGVAAYVDLPAVNAAYQRIVERAEEADGGDVQVVWRVAVLALWLRQLNAARPPAVAAA